MSQSNDPNFLEAVRLLQQTDKVLENLTVRPATYRECKRSLGLCWAWLGGEKIEPWDISESIEEVSPDIDIYAFEKDSIEWFSVWFISDIVCHFSYLAYEKAGIPASEIICESGPWILEHASGIGKKLGL